ncbi:hypothetical protein ACN38_g11454 [Penicillium nordicum]|uniref:Uncharacterized protein n=1 Tax=Penicillium nordicum TaxID=229535 RepID=A0A0N0RXN1_9EURO|nr:hypothetical protein ACN38_g11454 [Penicillium nordicum]
MLKICPQIRPYRKSDNSIKGLQCDLSSRTPQISAAIVLPALRRSLTADPCSYEPTPTATLSQTRGIPWLGATPNPRQLEPEVGAL